MASLLPPPPPPEQPPQVGMRFLPKDRELVNDILAKWLFQGVPLPRHANITVLKNLYADHPCRVFDMGGDPAGVNGDEEDEEEDTEEDDNGRTNNKKQVRKRYFMTPLKTVSTKGRGKRMVRTVEGFGTWKLEFTKDIKDKGEVLGYRKYFKYEKLSDKKCKKRQHQEDNNDDEWGMHEYTHVKNSTVALCCVTRRRTRRSSTRKRIQRANNNNDVNATSINEGVVNNSTMSSETGIVVDQDRDHHEVPLTVLNNAWVVLPEYQVKEVISTFDDALERRVAPSGMLAQSNIEAETLDHYYHDQLTIEEALECIDYGVPIVAKPALDDNSILEEEEEQQHEQQHHQNSIVEVQQHQEADHYYKDFIMQLEADLKEHMYSEDQAAVEQQLLDDPNQIAMMELDSLISRNRKKKAVS